MHGRTGAFEPSFQADYSSFHGPGTLQARLDHSGVVKATVGNKAAAAF